MPLNHFTFACARAAPWRARLDRRKVSRGRKARDGRGRRRPHVEVRMLEEIRGGGNREAVRPLEEVGGGSQGEERCLALAVTGRVRLVRGEGRGVSD